MRNYVKFFINGSWVEPADRYIVEVENPATETIVGRIALGGEADVDRAVAAARKAFASFSELDRDERLALLQRILVEYERRSDDLVAAVTEEMGAPKGLSERAQVPVGAIHLRTAIEVLKTYSFEEQRGATLIAKEPVGVCAFITPWNWPLNQIVCKVAPAIATGCTVILKPSEVAPFSGHIFAEIMDAAGVPAGVFNMVHGNGPGVGALLAAHRDVDMISFTGSTRAGIEVARNAAATVKRVHQELGGKSPLIILDDEDLPKGIATGIAQIMGNSGQSCNAPARMLVPASRMAEAAACARRAAEAITVGDPRSDVAMGPVVSALQWEKIQTLIKQGVAEGATLVTGGLGRPDGLDKGWFVKPTIFADVTGDMTIAREEIFGPVLAILGYRTEAEAIEIGNDTEYGLAGYVSGADVAKCRAIARRLRAGQVAINAARDMTAPFGGYKRSGNGREWGSFAFDEFLEIKAMLGYAPAASQAAASHGA